MTAPTPTTPTPAQRTSSTTGRPPVAAAAPWSGSRIVALVLGVLGAALGLLLLVTGGALVVVGGVDGYLTDGEATLRSSGYAVTVREIGVNGKVPDFATDDGGLARLRDLRRERGRRDAAVRRHRARARTSTATWRRRQRRGPDFEVDPFRADYRRHAGGAPDAPPGDQAFWPPATPAPAVASSSGTSHPGEWAVVVMNADASAGVDATVDVGATVPALRPVGIGFLVVGGVILVTGVVLIVVAAAGRRRSPYTAVPVAPAS
jgi:hypothetical protein